ncbi:hypothetical protein [Nocardia abscessus]|uniref:hypothetical protein n=1 Tax=Nocardia abscessus TaxID=120957 RepID=UPI0024559974|nr:hypothetical protein [Nocardia abscessus]
MPDEYDDFRRSLSNYEKGLYFELGRALERGEIPEKGWERQFKLQVGDKARYLDSARTLGRGVDGVERKSGRVNERDARAQLRVERAALDKGLLARSRWETVAGEKMPRAVAREMERMARDFPGRFNHVTVSRADALRAIQLGQSLVSKQLELIRPYELQRADRARERLSKIRQIVRAQERAEKFRKMQQFREAAARGRAEAPQKIERAQEQAEQVRQAREAEKGERARVERAAAERVALEFPVPEQFQLREAADTGEQAAREAAEPARAEREAVDARAAEEKAREAREAADKERAKELARLQARGVPPEVVKLLGLGQAQPPSAAVREPPGHAPGVVRGGTGQGQERSRGISRDR